MVTSSPRLACGRRVRVGGATILHLLGVDHTKLIYPHQGRPERVDLNEGKVFRGLAKA